MSLPKDPQGLPAASESAQEQVLEQAQPNSFDVASANPSHDTEAAAAQPIPENATEQQTQAASEAAPAPRAPPTSWANLFAKTPVAAVVNINGENDVAGGADGASNADGSQGVITSPPKAATNSAADAIRTFKVGGADKQNFFLEPRGLINTGNMCYMNSVSSMAGR